VLVTTVRVDVWSDLVCPWCYLGEHRLQQAIKDVDWGDEIRVRWRAYQLDPRAPREPQDLRRALERKYGPGAHDAMTRRLTALGTAEGLEYRFDRVQRVNSFDAQRLLLWAGESHPAAQMPLARRLLRAYFTDGDNLADHEVLLEAVGDTALDPAAAKDVLDGSAHGDEVDHDREEALERGITGVPAFVIEGTWLVPGAQEVETLVNVLERARAKLVV
jgi:predicted DsbA family dithiol-disulfide isomerase